MRQEQILNAAVDLAKEGNYQTVTRKALSDSIGCTEPLISYYFGSMDNLRSEILKYAVECEVYEIIVQGMIAKDPFLETVCNDILSAAWSKSTYANHNT